jgi:hypothetical protein
VLFCISRQEIAEQQVASFRGGELRVNRRRRFGLLDSLVVDPAVHQLCRGGPSSETGAHGLGEGP